MQTHRILNTKGPSLNKSKTTHKNSLWRTRTTEILAEYKLIGENLHISKQDLSKALGALNRENTYQGIRYKAISKTKIRPCMENKTLKGEQRPNYMTKVSRKQCVAIIQTRSSMLPVKANHKTKF